MTPLAPWSGRRLLSIVVTHTYLQQIVVVAASAVILPLYYLSLEFPKLVVNVALKFEPPHFPHSIDAFGIHFGTVDQLTLLGLYCAGFLLVQLAHGLMKMFVNVYQSLIGERMLMRMRRALCRIVDERAAQGAKPPSEGATISVITAELEPLSGFIGAAVATPLMEAGLLVTAFIFIFVQNALIGTILLAVYPLQLLVVPRLQARQTRLEALRVAEIRRLGTLVSGLSRGVRRSAVLHQADRLTERVYRTRRAFYLTKFAVNFLINFFGHLVPFALYLAGGILVVNGELSLGSLVAVVAAHKDLTPPWKELLHFWQTYQSAETKFAQTLSGVGGDPDRFVSGLRTPVPVAEVAR